ncbi:MAG: hypothetical protein QNJ74_26390 [Trichodesmium sp. MO_231.B1]|nr:hypothetical protein [Trichodesmium sp. MO_231.B1]
MNVNIGKFSVRAILTVVGKLTTSVRLTFLSRYNRWVSYHLYYTKHSQHSDKIPRQAVGLGILPKSIYKLESSWQKVAQK